MSFAEFAGPLMADICNQGRPILNGVDVNIKLWAARDEFRLITHLNGLRCKVEIEDIHLNVCKVLVTPGVMVGHNAALEVAKSKYPFKGQIFVHLIYLTFLWRNFTRYMARRSTK